jgi:Tol biopolymer transport system component
MHKILTAVAAGAIAATPTPAHASAAHNGRILFQAVVHKHTQIFTIQPNGSGLRQITHTADAEQADWAPDGSAIAFDAPGATAVDVFTIRPDGSSLTRVDLGVKGFNGAPSYSPDGTTIAFDNDLPSQPTVHGIFIANATGGGARRVTTGIASKTAYDSQADWSPDGSKLAFARFKGHGQAAIFTVKTDGSSLHQLTPWSLDAAYPSWSPDGSTIAFFSHDEQRPSKSQNICTIPAVGGRMKALTHYRGGKTHARGPAWSPDGTKIVWHKQTPRLDQIFVMDASGQHVRQLTHMPKGSSPGFARWGTN